MLPSVSLMCATTRLSVDCPSTRLGGCTVTLSRPEPMLLALKSGNFGGPDFFLRAFDALKEATR